MLSKFFRVKQLFTIICLGMFLLTLGTGNIQSLRAQTISPLSTVIPENIGVNIHFLDPKPGEMELLANAGFRWVRMDFTWEWTERTPGVYNFSEYDRLMEALKKQNIKPLFILDYANPLYDQGLAPHTDAGRQAFAKWAAAAVNHFRGNNILWEMWNEPNLENFWPPKVNANDYAKLALTVGKAIRTIAPQEIYIGPALLTMDMSFLETCFKAGLLKYWSAVSVHPYRQIDPETVTPEYSLLRSLITKYAPIGKKIKIISGEWGYPSTPWNNAVYDSVSQGKLIARSLLTNMMNGVDLSIWYDWRDDGTNPTDIQHNFGVVQHEYKSGQSPVYGLKPAYLAIQTLTNNLKGFKFYQKLSTSSPDEYILEFRNTNKEKRYAVWTTSKTPKQVNLSVASLGKATRFKVIKPKGTQRSSLQTYTSGSSLTLTDTPQYLVSLTSNNTSAPVKLNRFKKIPRSERYTPYHKN